MSQQLYKVAIKGRQNSGQTVADAYAWLTEQNAFRHFINYYSNWDGLVFVFTDLDTALQFKLSI
ncbi:hypothetical protein [Erythrobacter sp. R86502]|uniref:hypothetical protein n=1 Tax=Erythrobacter sp. R86502 TaxID=3093846 RepID=UPI0036D2D6D1